MYNQGGLDKKNLLVQLANFRLILEVNSDLLGNDWPLKAQILQCMGILEGHLEELNKWEGNNPIKYNSSLDEANKILEEIKLLMKQMLDRDTSPHDSLQNPSASPGSL